MRLSISNMTATKTYTLQGSAPSKPYLNIGGYYLPLSTSVPSGLKLKVQSGNTVYYPIENNRTSSTESYGNITFHRVIKTASTNAKSSYTGMFGRSASMSCGKGVNYLVSEARGYIVDTDARNNYIKYSLTQRQNLGATYYTYLNGTLSTNSYTTGITTQPSQVNTSFLGNVNIHAVNETVYATSTTNRGLPWNDTATSMYYQYINSTLGRFSTAMSMKSTGTTFTTAARATMSATSYEVTEFVYQEKF